MTCKVILENGSTDEGKNTIHDATCPHISLLNVLGLFCAHFPLFCFILSTCDPLYERVDLLFLVFLLP